MSLQDHQPNAAKAPWQPQKMAWWYWSLMDEMIAHPEFTKKELAERFKVAPATIYLVTESDLFKANLEQRRRNNSETLDAAIKNRLMKVADKTLATIETVLEKKRDTLPLEDLTTLADKTLQRLGYGIQPQAGVTVNTGPTQVVVPVSLTELTAARKALQAAESAKLIPAPQENLLDNPSPYRELEREQSASAHGDQTPGFRGEFEDPSSARAG